MTQNIPTMIQVARIQDVKLPHYKLLNLTHWDNFEQLKDHYLPTQGIDLPVFYDESDPGAKYNLQIFPNERELTKGTSAPGSMVVRLWVSFSERQTVMRTINGTLRISGTLNQHSYLFNTKYPGPNATHCSVPNAKVMDYRCPHQIISGLIRLPTYPGIDLLIDLGVTLSAEVKKPLGLEFESSWREMLSTGYLDMCRTTTTSDFDLMITCGGDAVQYASRYVLSIASPVFRTALTTDTQERNDGKYAIDDFDQKTVQQFLECLHTGKLVGCDSVDEGVSLLGIAEKYQVEKLKTCIEKGLKTMIDRGTIIKLLLSADRNHANNLKIACKRYLRGDGKNIVETEEFRNLKDEHGTLIAEVTLFVMASAEPQE